MGRVGVWKVYEHFVFLPWRCLRSCSAFQRCPPARLAGAPPALRRRTPACETSPACCKHAARKFRRLLRVLLSLRAESFTADLTAPLMLTLLPWDFLRPTRAYRYAGTCRARAGLPHARGRHTTLILWMLEQLELPTHLLHFVVRHTQYALEICAESRGELNEIYTTVCGDPIRMPAPTCCLGRQTS